MVKVQCLVSSEGRVTFAQPVSGFAMLCFACLYSAIDNCWLLDRLCVLSAAALAAALTDF